VSTLSVSLVPSSSLLLSGLAEAHLEKGDVPAAISAYERALAVLPANRNAVEMS
jgi:cytochrome c-type biogenesis protein CcmH/NrfG